jgi:hypothetical protein
VSGFGGGRLVSGVRTRASQFTSSGVRTLPLFSHMRTAKQFRNRGHHLVGLFCTDPQIIAGCMRVLPLLVRLFDWLAALLPCV